MRRRDLTEERCPIARAGGEIVDAWTLLILRELFLSNRSFEGLRRQTGMASGALAGRLAMLEESGILLREALEDKPRKGQYTLSDKGLELWPVVVALKQWGDKWLGPWEDGETPVRIEHRADGSPLYLEHVSLASGQTVTAKDARVTLGPAYAQDRAIRDADGKAARRKERNQ